MTKKTENMKNRFCILRCPLIGTKCQICLFFLKCMVLSIVASRKALSVGVVVVPVGQTSDIVTIHWPYY